ncbi:MAG TPA: alanine--glyoxylate aminotransferase family protein [Promineifilum sp.]|nr:alanine--glyoxylate aminotransferase family protein [Promineifilum sp.]HRO88880.1 alanine--glyoxylate aminotransferase family protein [Promineifilum sp.]HRQ11877.1 alanine--glyoxylate aminotransferase family protein [Promineifilum sp.]
MNTSNPDSSKHSSVRPDKHVKLFIPGPTEVRPEILDAQAQWMIGHRMPECADLIGSILPKLSQVFFTNQTVLITASSGTGLWEAAVRNCINKKALTCVNGAFASRFSDVVGLNGKDMEILSVPWGQPVLPEQIVERLSTGEFDAVTVVHNETSTGATSPIKEIAQAIRAMPGGEDIMILVDSVSGLSGARIEMDAWDLDVVLSSSQKAFALPPGLAFCAVSDRAMAKAKTVPARGYYFDFISLAKSIAKNQTPATPAVSLLYALDLQLDNMMAEGMENRFARHLAMRDRTLEWSKSKGFEIFVTPGYESPTVTCLANNLEIDISALNKYLRGHGMIISNGYGDLKGKTLRIAHMGDIQMYEMEELFAAMDGFFA